jgi:hypothetical protein
VPINPIATASARRPFDLEAALSIGPELEAKDASGETRVDVVRFLVDKKCWCWYSRDCDRDCNRGGLPNNCDVVERRRTDVMGMGMGVRVDHMVLDRCAAEDQVRRGLAGPVAG